ncbi:hypothetical protein QZH41_013603 [Actinostola sp. cb2023]|nr:hypothetical protein QZH41_013603 [Actinostola sp. cb2023]
MDKESDSKEISLIQFDDDDDDDRTEVTDGSGDPDDESLDESANLGGVLENLDSLKLTDIEVSAEGQGVQNGSQGGRGRGKKSWHGKSQNSNNRKKTNPNLSGTSSCGEDSQDSSALEEPCTFEEKVKYLQQNFKNFPPFVIRKVLNRGDVNEDLQAARNCLQDMTSIKGFNASPDPYRGNESGAQNTGRQRGQQGRGGSNRARRQCWGRAGAEDSSNETQSAVMKDEDTSDSASAHSVESSIASGAEENQKEGNKPKNKRNRGNRNQNKKQQNQNEHSNYNRGNWRGHNGQRGHQQQYGRGYFRGSSYPQSGSGPHLPQGYSRNDMGFEQQYNNVPYYYNGPPPTNPYQQAMPPFHEAWGPYRPPNPNFMAYEQQTRSHSEWDTRSSGPRSQMNNCDGRGNRGRGNRGRGDRGRGDRGRGDRGRGDRGRDDHGREGQHMADGVNRDTQSYSSPSQNQAMEPNTIVLRGINVETTDDSIQNFVEARTQEEVLDITLSDDHSTALIILANISDFNKAKQRVADRELDGSRLTIERVLVCSSIMVSVLSTKTSHDGLKNYLSLPRIGGDVSKIEFKKGDDHAIVTFEDSTVIHKVLNPKTPHKLDGVLLKVTRYYPFLHDDGSLQQRHDSEDIAIGVDASIMAYISETPHIAELKESLQRIGFTLKYDVGAAIAYIVGKEEELAAKQKGIETVTGFTQRFTQFKLTVTGKHWEAVVADVYELQHDLGKDKIHVVESQSKDAIQFVCHVSDSEDLKTKFSERIKDAQSSEVKKAFQTQTIEIEEEKLALLNKIDFVANHLSSRHTHPDVEVNFDLQNGTVTIIGPKRQCSEAKIKLYQHLTKMSERKVFLSPTIMEMLGSKKGMERVKREMEDKKIIAVFCLDEGEDDEPAKSFVVGVSSKDADQAADLIRGLTSEVKIKVEKENRDVLQSKRWITVCKELESNLHVHVRRNEFFDTWIAGFKDDVAKAYEMVKTFLDQNSVGTENFSCQDNGVRRYLLENMKDELSNIASALSQFSVDVKAAEKNNEFVISGSRTGVDRARNALHVLEGSITMKTTTIQQPGLNNFVARGGVDRLVKAVEMEHRCTIELQAQKPKTRSASSSSDESDHGGAASGYYGSPATVQASLDASSSDESDDDNTGISLTSGSSSVTYGNIRVSWKQGDIVNQNADILVGSIIGQLSKAFQVQTSLYGSMKAGSIALAQSNIPPGCLHLILTHCSSWQQSGNSSAEQMLRSTVQQCLQQALQLNATSIAFPVLGTAGLGFPKNTACRIMINEVVNVVSGWRGSPCVQDVRFVVFDQDAQLVAAFQQEFAANTGNSSSFGKSSSNPRRFGNVTINISAGDLIQEGTDAIVNIISSDMNLQSAGAVSKAIADKAYPGLQAECSSMGQLSAGSAVVSSAGGSLRCGKIIHVYPGQGDKHHIQKSIENCLRVADNDGFQSISLPALGTGGLKMSDRDSAQATFQAFVTVCPQLQNLRQIRIVIYQQQMVPTFQQVQQQYEVSSSSSSKRTVHGKSPRTVHGKSPPLLTKTSTTTTSMQFHVYGKSSDSVASAETSLIKGFSQACKTQKVEDENVPKLSERQLNALTMKANKLDVTIKFDVRIHRVVVRGDSDDVSTIINDIWKEIQVRSKKEKDSEQAKVLSKSIRWQYEISGQTKPFSKSNNAVIEKAHVNKNPRVTVSDVQGEDFIIDLGNSTGYGKSTGLQISISRTTIGVTGGQGTAFGNGVYFAKDASYSMGYAQPSRISNYKHMYLARVLVGRYTQGHAGLLVPPKDPHSNSHFDSVGNGPGTGASIFVVFYDAQCYPEYLITFQ